MATIEQRTSQDGKPVYRVKIRRKGAPPLTATFGRLTDAKKWAQITEGAVLEVRHVPVQVVKTGLMPLLVTAEHIWGSEKGTRSAGENFMLAMTAARDVP